MLKDAGTEENKTSTSNAERIQRLLVKFKDAIFLKIQYRYVD
jgi:hypothetical protein